MELEDIIISEMRQIPYDFTHMWNKSNKINEQTKPTKAEKGKVKCVKGINCMVTVGN